MSTSPDSTVHSGIEVANLTPITHLVDEEKNRKRRGSKQDAKRKNKRKQAKPGPVPHDSADDQDADGIGDGESAAPTVDYLA